jgi:hypothetical protein
MARQNGNHVEYSPNGAEGGPQILRVFGSQLKALLSAVESGNKVTFVEHGETLQEALARQSNTGPKPRSGATAAEPVKVGP